MFPTGGGICNGNTWWRRSRAGSPGLIYSKTTALWRHQIPRGGQFQAKQAIFPPWCILIGFWFESRMAWRDLLGRRVFHGSILATGNSPMPGYLKRGQSGRILRQLENTLRRCCYSHAFCSALKQARTSHDPASNAGTAGQWANWLASGCCCYARSRQASSLPSNAS